MRAGKVRYLGASSMFAWQFARALFDVVERAVALAEKRGVRPAQVALAWVLQQSGVTAPIVGASKLEQLDEAIAAVDLELDEAERASLEEPYRAREGRGFL